MGGGVVCIFEALNTPPVYFLGDALYKVYYARRYTHGVHGFSARGEVHDGCLFAGYQNKSMDMVRATPPAPPWSDLDEPDPDRHCGHVGIQQSKVQQSQSNKGSSTKEVQQKNRPI
jgi:hypothetical protein